MDRWVGGWSVPRGFKFVSVNFRLDAPMYAYALLRHVLEMLNRYAMYNFGCCHSYHDTPPPPPTRTITSTTTILLIHLLLLHRVP